MNNSWVRWAIWSLAIAFYCYEFVLRIAPSVMVGDLMGAFSLQAAQVGTLSACFLYAYAPAQLPVGVLMDRFGARRLLTFSSILCGVASLLFAFAPSFVVAVLSRLFMGIASSFGFLGMAYITSHWFPRERLALLLGLANSLGLTGGIIGQGPLSALVEVTNWRWVWGLLGLIGIALGGAIYLVVRNDPPGAHASAVPSPSMSKIWKGFKQVCGNPQTWLNSWVSICLYAPTAAFAGLWGVPFLQVAYGFGPTEAGFATSMIYLGWIIGGPLVGLASDASKTVRPIFMSACFLATIAISAVIYVPLPIVLLYAVLILLGMFLSGQLLNYTFAIEINPPESKGTAIAITNLITMLFGAFFQPIIGRLLDARWDGTNLNGVPIYSLETYRTVLSLFPALLIVGGIAALFIKRIHYHERLTEELVSFNYEH